MKTSTIASILVSLVLTIHDRPALAAVEENSVAWPQHLEKEWLLEARLHIESRQSSTLTTPDDAAGGCDGVRNGKWGFHTAQETDPWWQVDLGETQALKQVRIWNRSDNEDAARKASGFRIMLSMNGANWREVYRHTGGLFYGYRMPDRAPLTVKLARAEARYVRIQLSGTQYLHLDEVEVIGQKGGNLALNKPADQSSLSQWSTRKPRQGATESDMYPLPWLIDRADQQINAWQTAGLDVTPFKTTLTDFTRQTRALIETGPAEQRRALYFKLRAWLRQLSLTNPNLDFDSMLFTKRVPGSFSHMSDQYYGWWSRPGGGIYLLRNLKSDTPSTECLTDQSFREPGSFLRPSLSYDASKVLFAWCRHYPELAGEKDKLNKANVPEDAFYHVYEMNIDGSGVRRLTRGKYDDFDARYLPDGRIVFLSTRRGQAIQVGRQSAAATLSQPDQPDCYVRCGGDASRPVAVYTLHTMNADGSDLCAISPFEMFEWEPSIANDGTILYSRWDYIDRDNMPFMSLWSINPDGTNSKLVYGNYTWAPHCTFEPRAIPGSDKIIFTASGHHAQTMGSLVLLDPAIGTEGKDPITRLTPETPFPEIEGWPRAFYANPWPLSENTHLVSWGVEGSIREGTTRSRNGMGLYLFDTRGGWELLYRDPDISSMYPIPLQSRTRPPDLASTVDWDGPQEGRFFVVDVTRGLTNVSRGDVKALRIVAVPAKTQPWMNQPVMGLTRDDPGKAVLGTVPVERDGSAHFRAPSGVTLFFQALNADGLAIQTMRSATHVQPGQTLSCTGCHDSSKNAPPSSLTPLAALREPSKITVGPEGSWTMRFDRLVQPVLDQHCVSCHGPGSTDLQAARYDLTPDHAYESLVDYGNPSLRVQIITAYRQGISRQGQGPAQRSALLAKLADQDVHGDLSLDRESMERLATWMDTYAQRMGTFSPEQEQELNRLRQAWGDLLQERSPLKTAARSPE